VVFLGNRHDNPAKSAVADVACGAERKRGQEKGSDPFSSSFEHVNVKEER
jgi:hypothetical protein